MKKERHHGALFVVSGYSMMIYCQYCMDSIEPSFDGPNCYADSRKYVRNRGWVLHKDGYATCKKCNQTKP